MKNERLQQPYLVFILFLSLFALIALAVETVFRLDEGTRQILAYADTLICLFFFIDFLVSWRQAPKKWKYLLTWGWLDLVSSIPMLDALRWGRTARAIRILRVLRGIRAARILSTFILERRAQAGFMAAALLTILFVVIASVAMLHFEAESEGSIKTADDAAWWAITTITTVGYGDKCPVTPEGKIIAALLMTAGVGLFGAFSGFVAAWFLAPGETQREDQLAAIRVELAELKKMLAGRNA